MCALKLKLLDICYHNVCIEIESFGYLFIFTLRGDKDKSDFVLYIILVKTKSDKRNLRNKIILINVNVLFLQSVQGFVIGISEVEKSLFYHANIFYSESS